MDEQIIGPEDVASLDAAAVAEPVDIWAEVGEELQTAYAAREQLQAAEEELRTAKRANAEEIQRLEAEHVEAHKAGGEPQTLGG